MIFNMPGYLPDAVTKDMVVNNFTTTEEGFVADARALKVLNDMLTPQNVNVTMLDCAKLGDGDAMHAYRIGNIITVSAAFKFVTENMKPYMGNSRLFKLPFNLKRMYFWIVTRGVKSQLIEVRADGEIWCNYQDTMSTDTDKTAGFTFTCVIDG